MVAEGTLPVYPGWRNVAHENPALRSQKGWVKPAYKAEIAAAYAAGESCREVAARFGVAHQTVLTCAVQAGVPIRPKGLPNETRPEPLCTPRERIERWTAAVNAAPSPLMDAKQAAIDERNAEDAAYRGSAFHDAMTEALSYPAAPAADALPYWVPGGV